MPTSQSETDPVEKWWGILNGPFIREYPAGQGWREKLLCASLVFRNTWNKATVSHAHQKANTSSVRCWGRGDLASLGKYCWGRKWCNNLGTLATSTRFGHTDAPSLCSSTPGYTPHKMTCTSVFLSPLCKSPKLDTRAKRSSVLEQIHRWQIAIYSSNGNEW
jgi:hypothetical protein